MKRAVFIGLVAMMLPWGGLAADEPESSPAPKTRHVVVRGAGMEKPVILEYKPDLTVMSALGSVEISSISSVRNVHLIRDGKVIVCNCKRMRSHPEEDLKLLPGDVLQMANTFF